MRSRVTFALCLLVALGAHAVLLLVPHFPVRKAGPIRTVEINLQEGGFGGAELPDRPRAAAAAPTLPVSHRVAPGAQLPAQIQTTERPAVPQPTKLPPVETLVPTPAPPEASDQDAVAGTEPAAAGEAGAGSVPSSGLETGSSEGSGSQTASGGAGSGAGGGEGEETGSGGGSAAEAGFHPPQPLRDIHPQYPRSARRAGWEGLVRITALVDEAGVVRSAEVSSSSGHSVLDQAALDMVRQTLFDPASQDGRAVACRVIIPVRFQLR